MVIAISASTVEPSTFRSLSEYSDRCYDGHRSRSTCWLLVHRNTRNDSVIVISWRGEVRKKSLIAALRNAPITTARL